MPSPRRLMCAHIDALFTRDPGGRLVRINEPGGGRAPRFFIGRTREGVEWRVREDSSDAVVRKLEAASLSEPAGEGFLDPPHGSEPYESILAGHAAVERKWAGPAYHFPADVRARGTTTLITSQNSELLREHLRGWLDDAGVNDPLVVTVLDGSAVAVCGSVRKGSVADEAGVETAVGFRRRGYAAAAVAGWAAIVRERGRLPLYSTSWENPASMALAHRLGLLRYGATLHIT